MELKLLEITYDTSTSEVKLFSQVSDPSSLKGLLAPFVRALAAADREGLNLRVLLELFSAMEMATHFNHEQELAFVADLSRSFRPAVEGIDSWLKGGS